MSKRIFPQVMEKGFSFSFVFFLFFMMSTIPIIMLFLVSVIKGNLPGIALALVFGAVLAKDMQQRHLFALCRDMAVLNLTLWFLLGFFSLIEGFATALQGYLAYVLLVPYAIISGYLVFYLLSRADSRRDNVIKGAVAVSTMIAVISAINGAIMHALQALSTHMEQLVDGNGTTQMVSSFIPTFHNPHLSFIVVLVLFNIPFIAYYLRKGKTRRQLWWYLVPLAAYVFLTGLWSVFRGTILG